MRVKVTSAYVSFDNVTVRKADFDGDVYINRVPIFLDRASTRRLAKALLWAARPTPRKAKRR